MKRRGILNKDVVVSTIMSNSGLVSSSQKIGVNSSLKNELFEIIERMPGVTGSGREADKVYICSFNRELLVLIIEIQKIL